MKKIFALFASVPALAGMALAQGTSIIDTTQLATDATQIKTDITDFFSGSIGPLVLGVAGAALLVWLAIKLIKWAKRAAN